MQLKLVRSQRDSGIVSKAVVFCLDARVHLTPEEQANVNRYKLGGQVIYSSEASQRHLINAKIDHIIGTTASITRGIGSLALAALHLNISINGLQRGQHIECKTLDELLEAENALIIACQNLRTYLDTAATFDGRAVLLDFTDKTPTVITSPDQPALALPSQAPFPEAEATAPFAASPEFASYANAYDGPAQGAYPSLMSEKVDAFFASMGRLWRDAPLPVKFIIASVGFVFFVALAGHMR